jgi:diacylglycerol O-acyltransferase
MPANITGVVSNVAGSPFPLYSAGAKMLRYYGIGLLTPGMGMFSLAFSADGILTLSILADRDTMSDPSVYRDFMYESFEELREAAVRYQTGDNVKVKKSASSSITPIARSTDANRPGAMVAKPKASPRKAKAVKTVKAVKAKTNGSYEDAVASRVAKTGKAKATKKIVARVATQPPAKAPVQKAKLTNGTANEPIKSLFDETMDEKAAG